MNRHDEALQVLLILRRRLLDRMSTAIVDRKDSLLNGRSKTNSPLSSDQDLAEMIRSLSEIDHAISGLADVSRNGHDVAGGEETVLDDQTHEVFGKYLDLVRDDRLEEASRELSQVFQMSRDRVITATRFFARCLKADPNCVRNLIDLADAVTGDSESEAMRIVIKTFGFQAVESRMAIAQLRTRLMASSS